MSNKDNPRSILVRLQIDEIREGKSGRVIIVAIASGGKRLKIPMDDIVRLKPQNGVVELDALAS